MEPQEFKKILDRINLEIAHELHENAKAIRFWFKVVGISTIFIVGILLFPILLQKSRKQSKLLAKFQVRKTFFLFFFYRKM